jgi:hypothetical protein
MRGLIINEPWIGLILSGQKTWEMRTRTTKVCGWIGLIRKGSGQVVGAARLEEVLPRLAWKDYDRHFAKHRIPPTQSRRSFKGAWTVPWALADARPLPKPVRYSHRRGAVIWVVLSRDVARRVRLQLPSGATPFVSHLLAIPKDGGEFKRVRLRRAVRRSRLGQAKRGPNALRAHRP